MKLGAVAHVVQLAIGRRILGYTKAGDLVPFAQSFAAQKLDAQKLDCVAISHAP